MAIIRHELFSCFAVLSLSICECQSNYGFDWVLFPDDEGRLYFANLTIVDSVLDTASRNIYFHLYTSRNKNEYEEIFIPDENETMSIENLDPANEFKFVTHGWLSGGNSTTVIAIKNAYLQNNDYNVIIVDWHEIADEILYVLAATSTRYVGYKVSQMIISLMKNYNVDADRFHLVGHSLGAHVMGYGGRYTQSESGSPVARVTGLDPARPLFEFPPTDGLYWNDATFVDIIHSCAGVLGYYWSRGDADFYPNNGKPPQPGCDGISQLIDACSHARAHQYFAESINSDKGFFAYPCESYSSFEEGNCSTNETLMGELVSTDARGDYYLTTNQEGEYARGNTQSKNENSDG